MRGLDERAYWLAWSRVRGIGPVTIARIKEYFWDLGTAWDAPAKAFFPIEGLGKKSIESLEQNRRAIEPEALFEEHLAKGWTFWTPVDNNYPRLLLEIPSPPLVLYYRGQVNEAENQGINPLVGIVGTRNPTEYGRRWTRKIARCLAQHGFTVVSGMASGIDTEAHRMCLEAGGRTIAVLGTGIDVIYPRSNERLYQQIQERGLILSDYPPGTQPDGGNFPPRNRIIAGLCRATLVMEAAERSGALITARYANEFGRDVYTLPGSLDQIKSMGCLKLVENGAHLILGEEELLKLLGDFPQLDRVNSPSDSTPSTHSTPSVPVHLNPEQEEVFKLIGNTPISFDRLVEESGKPSSFVAAILLQLELEGLVSSLPGMQYQRQSF